MTVIANRSKLAETEYAEALHTSGQALVLMEEGRSSLAIVHQHLYGSDTPLPPWMEWVQRCATCQCAGSDDTDLHFILGLQTHLGNSTGVDVVYALRSLVGSEEGQWRAFDPSHLLTAGRTVAAWLALENSRILASTRRCRPVSVHGFEQYAGLLVQTEDWCETRHALCARQVFRDTDADYDYLVFVTPVIQSDGTLCTFNVHLCSKPGCPVMLSLASTVLQGPVAGHMWEATGVMCASKFRELFGRS